MSVLLLKVLWYRVEDIAEESVLGDNVYGQPTNITDAIDFNISRGMDIRNNVLVLHLKNSWQKYISNNDITLFQEQDQIKVYAKYADDGNIVGFEDDTAEPNPNYLLGIYYVIEYGGLHTDRSTSITLKCADKTYVMFNRTLPFSFTDSDTNTTAEKVQKIVRLGTYRPDGKGRFQGTGSDIGATYDINAKLVREGGYITSSRRSTTEVDGVTNADLIFPAKPIALIWKPIYEWVNELSQIQHLNTDAELSSTLVYGRPFIFWIDEDNCFHWVYPSQTEDSNIVVGSDNVYSVSMTKKVFDITNMVIYNAGKNMYNADITGYVYYAGSDSKTLKMTFIPMTDISQTWLTLDYNKNKVREGSVNWSSTVTGGSPFPQFPTDASYNLTPAWGAFTYAGISYGAVSSDTEYNSSFEAYCKSVGDKRAANLLAGVGNARWTGTIELKGQKFSAGNLVKFTDTSIGLYEELLRIMNISHKIAKNGWFTNLTLEKDAKALSTGG